MFVGVRSNNSDAERKREYVYVHSVVIYQKYLTRLGEMMIV